MLLVWDFSAFNSTQFPEGTLLPIGQVFGVHCTFSCFLASTGRAPLNIMCLDINQENGHHPILFPPRNFLLASDVVFSDQATWTWAQWQGDLVSAVSVASELHLQWGSWHAHIFTSAAGLKTICRRNMGFTSFVLNINIYWHRNLYSTKIQIIKLNIQFRVCVLS